MTRTELWAAFRQNTNVSLRGCSTGGWMASWDGYADAGCKRDAWGATQEAAIAAALGVELDEPDPLELADWLDEEANVREAILRLRDMNQLLGSNADEPRRAIAMYRSAASIISRVGNDDGALLDAITPDLADVVIGRRLHRDTPEGTYESIRVTWGRHYYEGADLRAALRKLREASDEREHLPA